jgi:SAM-dependent methyltransferase
MTGERAFEPDRWWFDHHIDAQWRWMSTTDPSFLERGVFGNLAIEPGARILELCCGDGFNARHFYAGRAREVVAVDASQDAIAHARRLHDAPNIAFEVSDIRSQLPDGPFDNAVWDTALEYFTDEDVAGVLRAVKARLRPGGVLSGHAVRTSDVDVHLYRELHSKEDLARLLRMAFAHVCVFETASPSRVNYYFYASDARDSLPLADGGHPRFLLDSGDL